MYKWQQVRAMRAKGESIKGIFTEEKFMYNQESDTYTCPAGYSLKRKSLMQTVKA